MPQRLLRAEKAPFCKVRRDSPSFLKNNFLFYVGVWLINNVVMIVIQQIQSYIYMYDSFSNSFPI